MKTLKEFITEANSESFSFKTKGRDVGDTYHINGEKLPLSDKATKAGYAAHYVQSKRYSYGNPQNVGDSVILHKQGKILSHSMHLPQAEYAADVHMRIGSIPRAYMESPNHDSAAVDAIHKYISKHFK